MGKGGRLRWGSRECRQAGKRRRRKHSTQTLLGSRIGTGNGVGGVMQCFGHGIAGISYFTFILLFVVYI